MTGAERWLRLVRQRASRAEVWQAPSLLGGPSRADLAGSDVRDAVAGAHGGGAGSRHGGGAGG